MKAIAFTHCLPATDPAALQDIELPQPTRPARPAGARAGRIGQIPSTPRCAAPPRRPLASRACWAGMLWARRKRWALPGQRLCRGDRVYYAGAINRPGSNSEWQLVDARIAAHAPRSLSDAQAAALPLTTITAWELLFDRLGMPGRRRRAGATDCGRCRRCWLHADPTGPATDQLRVMATASRPDRAVVPRPEGRTM